MPVGRVWRIGSAWFAQETAPLIRAILSLVPQLDAEDIVIGWRALWRRRAMALWDIGAYDELTRRLSGTLQIYAPWNALYWGRLLARSGRSAESGMYLLLSGLYDPEEIPIVTVYQRRYHHATPNQIVAELPIPVRMRWARAHFPDRVLADFAAMPSPPWLRRRVPWPEDILRLANDHVTPLC